MNSEYFRVGAYCNPALQTIEKTYWRELRGYYFVLELLRVVFLVAAALPAAVLR